MSEVDQRNQAISEVATRNARAAVNQAKLTRDELQQKLDQQQAAINVLAAKIIDLERKYNLLLTKNFNGKSTAE